MDIATAILGFADSIIDTPEEQEERKLKAEQIKLQAEQEKNKASIAATNAAAQTQQVMFIAIAVGVVGLGAIAFFALK